MKNKSAVCIHIYYIDMWDYICGYLKNIPSAADIFFTCRKEIYEEVQGRAAEDFPHANVVTMPNLGMDVIPFLLLVKEKRLYEYAAVLKLHTKNQKSELRSNQGKIMMDGLCGNPDMVQEIIDLFEEKPDIGIIGTAFQLRSANALMYGNRPRMASLLKSLDIDLTDWPFFTGTMFWIAGRLLHDLADQADDFLAEAEREAISVTGGDGSIAHTLERVFGALSEARSAKIYVTEPRDPHSGKIMVLPLWRHGPANSRRFLELGSSDLVRRYTEASNWYNIITKSDLFDSEFYKKNNDEYNVFGMNEIYHFIIYGDLFQINPSERFDVTYYQIRRKDVVRAYLCSLVHYLNSGKREGISANPNARDWQELASREGLFDEKWYAARHPEIALSDWNPAEHYLQIGQSLRRAGSAKFSPNSIPALKKYSNNSQEEYLKLHYIDEKHLYNMMKRSAENGDYSILRSISYRVSELYGHNVVLDEAIATSLTLEKNWDKARTSWFAFWNDFQEGDKLGRHGNSILKFDRPSKILDNFSKIKYKNSNNKNYKNKNICVYTTLFGDIDHLPPINYPNPDLDYICFTDKPRKSSGWKEIIIDTKQNNNNLNAKILKILPHKYLENYEFSMFVDANTVFVGKIDELVDLCINGGDFVMWQHPLRDDVYTEVCAIIGHRRHSPDLILDQLKHYADQGMPRDTGMFEASFIWRRHMAPDVIAFMESWWAEITIHSRRDQISLAWLVWKTGFRPCLLPREAGTSRENIYFFKAPHRDGRVRAKDETNPALSAPALRVRDRNITFVYHDKYAATGSTILRGQQLSSLVHKHYDGRREVSYSSDAASLRDQIIVLTKGFLKMTSPEQLQDLRRHNILIADFVDEPPIRGLIPQIDVLMASSQLGYKDYLNRFPDVPSFHVTHHVDTRLPKIEEAAIDSFRAGYFGELVNTIIFPEMDPLVSFHLVDTSQQDDSWILELGKYNFHYAFRQSRRIDGAKPFLKGFVAAHCGANMIIQKGAGDAAFYLGNEYPYLMADNATPTEILETLNRARDTIGGPEWLQGREIMREVAARSSTTHVMQEFDNMISFL